MSKGGREGGIEGGYYKGREGGREGGREEVITKRGREEWRVLQGQYRWVKGLLKIGMEGITKRVGRQAGYYKSRDGGREGMREGGRDGEYHE